MRYMVIREETPQEIHDEELLYYDRFVYMRVYMHMMHIRGMCVYVCKYTGYVCIEEMQMTR
jgi:hypothetical protein